MKARGPILAVALAATLTGLVLVSAKLSTRSDTLSEATATAGTEASATATNTASTSGTGTSTAGGSSSAAQLSAAAQALERRCPWLSPARPVATRVNELLAAMTPRDEAVMLHLLKVGTNGVPYQGYTPAIPALCIPIITEQDGAAGVAMGFHGVTQLPAPIANAAAFDPTLAGDYGSVIGAEDAAKGVDMALAPTINIDRSPLWGRSYESLGEDPYLTASLAVPLVNGIQSHRVVAVVKHYAAYNQETKRGTLQDDSVVSERALREIYLPAWSSVVQLADPGAVMCSYNLVNGTPACENEDLLQNVLRDEWGFSGFVRSDCGSVYNETAAIAAKVSQVKCTALYNADTLAAAVKTGEITKSALDALARPLFTVLFQYNLIGSPHPLTPEVDVTSASHSAVALAADNEGAVLLKNTGGLLPLNFSSLASVALIGAHDGTPMPAGFGAVRVQPTNPVSALTALRARLGYRVHYDSGANIADAAESARHAQVAIVVVSDTEAEGRDRVSLQLPGDQDRLIGAVEAANPRTVVVLETGSAVLMPWLPQTPALLETWYPGETAGTSLVALLSGEVNPSGKLPVSFPVNEANMPDNTSATFGGVDGKTQYADGIDVGYRWYETHPGAAAFAFGYGLSYTKFHYSDLHITANNPKGVALEATVANTGHAAGATVVQCYVGAPAASGEPPRQLRGFQRVQLAPGQSKTVQLHLTPGDLAQWSDASNSWIIAPGTYHIWVGDGSDLANLPLSETVTLRSGALGVNSGLTPYSN
jgi:beta-glucosidase